MQHFSVIIPAGGRGKRMNAEVPKQFLPLMDKPVVMRTLEKFHSFDNRIKIILVLPENQISYWENLCRTYHFTIPHRITAGGSERFFSVKNALQMVDTELVAVHDAVRPLVSLASIERVFAAAEKYGAAVPVMPVNESMRKITDNANRAVDRAEYCIVQTPQAFHTKILSDAYSQEFNESFTDDASVVESIGRTIALTEGNRENIKITTPADLHLAEILWREQVFTEKNCNFAKKTI